MLLTEKIDVEPSLENSLDFFYRSNVWGKRSFCIFWGGGGRGANHILPTSYLGRGYWKVNI